MTQLLIDLPEDLEAKLRVRAAAAGYADAERYVQAMIAADVREFDASPGAPPNLSFDTASDVEAKLLEGIHSGPPTEMTSAHWEQMRERLAERHARQGAP